MNVSLQLWLQMGTIRRRSADLPENMTSRPIKTEMDNEPSVSAAGYLSKTSLVKQ